MNTCIIANQFLNEITQKKLTGGRWMWERYLEGPLNWSQANKNAQVAGCWVYDLERGGKAIRFC